MKEEALEFYRVILFLFHNLLFEVKNSGPTVNTAWKAQLLISCGIQDAHSAGAESFWHNVVIMPVSKIEVERLLLG